MTIDISVHDVAEDEPVVHSVPSDYRIEDLLEEIGKNPEAHVVKREDKIVPEDEVLEDGDELEIIPVVSGG